MTNALACLSALVLCWHQGCCKGNSLLERRKGRSWLFSCAHGWEEEEKEEDGAVPVVDDVLTSPVWVESP